MDFEIPHAELKKQSHNRYLKIGAAALLVLAAVFAFRNFIHPSIDYRSLKTARVTTGSIQAILTARGAVVPEFEQSISSPLQARIDSVYHPAGTLVKRGAPILKLDLSYSQLELEKLQEGLQKRRNEANLIRLRMEKNLADLQSQYDIKKLRISSLEKYNIPYEAAIKYFLYVGALHGLLLALTIMLLRDKLWWFLATELSILISLYVA